jgi:hypothetical protein
MFLNRPRRLLVALAATTVGIALAAPAEAPAALKSIWGPEKLPNGSSAFPVYRDLGVDVFQEGLLWSGVARRRPAQPRDPNDPAYTWPAELDALVAEADRNGIEVALEVLESPSWANGGREPKWGPENVSDYADFLVAAKRKYPQVRHWMIWGEPSGGTFLPMPKHSARGPRAYARLVDAAYGALKAEDPRNIVIGGMSFTSGLVEPQDFIRWIRLPSGRPPRLDWWGHNPFSRRFPRLSDPPSVHRPKVRDFNDLDTLRKELKEAYRGTGRTPRLWLSEFTIQSDGPSDSFNFWTNRQGQARWLTQAYRIADRTSWIAGLGWVELLDLPVLPPLTKPIHWGLLTVNGEKKPSYFAYLEAPSRRFTPAVTVPSRASSAELARGLPISITPKRTGRIELALLSAEGKTQAKRTLTGTDGETLSAQLQAGGVAPGRYTVTVKAIRGELVQRTLVVG